MINKNVFKSASLVILLTVFILVVFASIEAITENTGNFFEEFSHVILISALYETVVLLLINTILISVYNITQNKKQKEKNKLQSNINTLFKEFSIVFFDIDKDYIVSNVRSSEKTNSTVRSIITEGVRSSSTEINNYIDITKKKREKQSSMIVVNDTLIKYYYSIIVDPIYRGKEYLGSSCVLVDISEQKSIIKRLKDSEKRLSDYINNIPNIIIEFNLNGDILYINKSATNKMGYSDHNLPNVFDIIRPDQLDFAKNRLKKILNEFEKNLSASEEISSEYAIKDANEEFIYFNVTTTVRRNEFGTLSFLSSLSDISTIKEQKISLENQLTFEKIISSINRDFSNQDTSSIHHSLKTFSEYLELDMIYIFTLDKEENEISVYNKYIRNKNNKIKTQEDNSALMKAIYKLAIAKNYSYIDKNSEIDLKLKQFLFEKLNMKFIMNHKISNDHYDIMISYLSHSREKILESLDMSAFEIYTDMLLNVISKNLFLKKVGEQKETLDVILFGSIMGVLIYRDKEIIYINKTSCDILEVIEDDILNKNINYLLQLIPDLYKYKNDFIKNMKSEKKYRGKMIVDINNKRKIIICEAKPVSSGDNESILITFFDVNMLDSDEN